MSPGNSVIVFTSSLEGSELKLRDVGQDRLDVGREEAVQVQRQLIEGHGQRRHVAEVRPIHYDLGGDAGVGTLVLDGERRVQVEIRGTSVGLRGERGAGQAGDIDRGRKLVAVGSPERGGPLQKTHVGGEKLAVGGGVDRGSHRNHHLRLLLGRGRDRRLGRARDICREWRVVVERRLEQAGD